MATAAAAVCMIAAAALPTMSRSIKAGAGVLRRHLQPVLDHRLDGAPGRLTSDAFLCVEALAARSGLLVEASAEGSRHAGPIAARKVTPARRNGARLPGHQRPALQEHGEGSCPGSLGPWVTRGRVDVGAKKAMGTTK